MVHTMTAASFSVMKSCSPERRAGVHDRQASSRTETLHKILSRENYSERTEPEDGNKR
jgi:hypothetical protein